MLVTFSPRLSTLTVMPRSLTALVAARHSSTETPATKRLDIRRPSADFSEKWRSGRFSERAIKKALNTWLRAGWEGTDFCITGGSGWGSEGHAIATQKNPLHC